MSLEPGPPSPGVPRLHRQSIQDLLARYGLEPVGEPQPVADSVLNQNYRVPTSGGLRFVRFHRKGRTLERLELEQDVIRFAAGQAIPVVSALSDRQGRVFNSLANQFVSMYDWAPGTHLPREGITPGQSALLGDLHGRIHAALRDFRDPRLPDRGTGSGWDREASLDTLGRVDDLIRYYPAQDAVQLELQSGLRRQMEMLESGVAWPAADFAELYRQCCHGDFHERNVIIGDGGEVMAVVDWEMAGLLPPSFELLRALTFMGLLEAPLASPYFDAYRRHAEVRDWEASVEMWWQSQLHNVWVYEARYIEGNRAVEPFLAEHVRLLARLGDPDYRASLVSLPRRT